MTEVAGQVAEIFAKHLKGAVKEGTNDLGTKRNSKAVYAVLSADPTLTTLLGGVGRVFDHVPDNTAYPYVTISMFPFNDRGSYDRRRYG